MSMDKTPVTVVAVLPGPSVANAQESAGRKLSPAERQAIKAQRRSEQLGKRAQIEAAGGRVIGSFQSAVNGLKVRIPQNQIAALRQVPGVVKVLRVNTYHTDNAASVPRINAPAAWSGVNGVHGEHIKVGIIDTGIDYTHANFGGPGTVAAFDAAAASSTAPADPAYFGPNAPKVKGGIDLVGDDYNANVDDSVPVPDPNPLDCNGHGSHVAGTAAGFGVKSDGTTYSGSYDNLTHANNQFLIGPGVAPKADLYAIRVFGCAGSTNVVVEAIEWAIDNDMDVINMSLGSDFGPADSADALAADDAVKAGVVVVMSAGNAGNVNYITGSPGTSTKGIAVAAGNKELNDRTAIFSLPAVPSGPAAKNIGAINANNGNFISPANLEVVVLRDATGAVSLGCDPAEYVAAGVAGKIAVVQRGVCARVARAVFGQQAGAAAVVMINNATTLPPFEGEITGNPDTGEQYLVTIPFFGVRGLAATSTSDGFALAARHGMNIGITEGTPIVPVLAAFTSTGPRLPDAKLKPDVAAPGVNIVSTLVGGGNQSLTISGTSMAAPHVTGVAALVLQSHPKWKPAAVKSAIMNSGDASAFSDYAARRAGTGMVNAGSAVGTQAYVFADKDETTVNFGVEEFSTDLSRTRKLTVKNDAATPATFNISVERKAGSPHTVTTSLSQITVPAKGQANFDMTLTVPAATAGNSDTFRDAAGLVTLTPDTAASNKGISMRVAYYLVPRVSSNVDAKIKFSQKTYAGTVTVTNAGSPIAATADFYAWGLEDPYQQQDRVDLRAAGVQAFDFDASNKLLVFAVNDWKPWSTPISNEFDISIDSNGDGNTDFIVFNVDLGWLQTGDFTGQNVAAVYNVNTGTIAIDFLTQSTTDSSTMLIPVLSSRLGLSAANPRFTYQVTLFDFFGDLSDNLPDKASFNAWTPAITNGQFVTLAPNATVEVPVSAHPTEALVTRPKGYMIVTTDNKNGAKEAKLLRMEF
ncbi:MAG TPA: S8 family serine peptidase [Steroidobacteraceae bacterium]|nr:S8 family serine peptidase [Steroidobacteraceae bacterium]